MWTLIAVVLYLSLMGMLVNRIVSLQAQMVRKNASIEALLATVDTLQGIIHAEALASVCAPRPEENSYLRELTERLHRSQDAVH